MKGYCSVLDIENYSLTEVDANFEVNVEGWIAVAEQIIEKETGRVFIADSSNSKRYFDGNGEIEFYIDECISINSVKIYDVDGTLLYTLVKDVDYIVKPSNELPIRKLKLKWGSEYKNFTTGDANIEIDAKWGYSVAVPDVIKWATTVIATGIMNFSNNADGEIKSEKIGDYQVSYKDEQFKDLEIAKGIIGQFTKHDV